MRKVQTFERIVLALKQYWQKKGCLLFESYNSEVGAGTFNPATFIRVLDEQPWNVCYVEVSKRPRDGRYGENPDRVEQHRQMQVIMKPAPRDIQKYYLQSLESLGLKLNEHEVRFVEGDWEAPTLGAWGLGWEVWLDGSEITQFTYFQQAGGIDLKITPVEITYGLERIATIVQEVPSIYDIKWNRDITWGDVLKAREVQFSAYNFEIADPKFLKSVFALYEEEARRALDKGSVLPGYDYCVKCSNIFNILEARGAISISERAKMIGRVRALANQAARSYIEQNQPAREPQ
ncbi:glycine--tRNA ligase subunit alpha [candidate division WOR-3 bacterium]|nr:glycine--tRNA ligase subunit alpha [candidate division WOR-3 bacterium]